MRLLLVGYYGGINYGDEALLQVILEKCREIDSNIEVVPLTLNESYTKIMHGLNNVPYNGVGIRRTSYRRLIVAIRRSDIVIIGGGGVLHDMKHRLSMTFYLFPIILAKLLGKPAVFFSVAVDPPIHSLFNKILLRLTCILVDHISVRDQMSKTYLKSIGVKRKINLIGDPVLMLNPEKEGLKTIFAQEGIAPSKLIGVNVREWGRLSEEVVNSLPQVLNHFVSDGYQIIFLCSPNDVEISKKIIDKINNSCCLILATKYKPSLMVGLISKLNLIVTMRLHFAISAVVAGTPCVVLPYLHKVKNFAEKFSIPCIDINSKHIPNLLQTLKKAANNFPRRQQVLYQYQGNTINDLKHIFGLYGKGGSFKEKVKAFFVLSFLFCGILWYTLPLNRKKASRRYW